MARRSVLVYAFSVLLASSQSVISTHSGVVLFADGAVSIDGRTIPPHSREFPYGVGG